MNKFLVCLLLCSAFLIAACGSSILDSGYEYHPDVFDSNGVADKNGVIFRQGDGSNPDSEYVMIRRTDDGLKLEYRDVSNAELLGPAKDEPFIFHAANKHFEEVLEKNSWRGRLDRAVTSDSPRQISHYSVALGGQVEGTVTQTAIAEVGGSRAGLSHADFGFWRIHSDFDLTIDGVPYKATLTGKPILGMTTAYVENGGWKMGFTPMEGGAEFTGNVLGVVREHSDTSASFGSGVAAAKSAAIYGRASLNVNREGRSGSLSLDFNDFGKVYISSVGISSSGKIDENSRRNIYVEHHGNQTGMSLDDGKEIRYRLAAQFFGSGDGDPSEAVGTLEIMQNRYGKQTNLDAVFGVNK